MSGETLNPSARKKAKTLTQVIGSTGAAVGPSEDARGAEGVAFELNATLVTAGSVTGLIEGRHSSKDAWVPIPGLEAADFGAIAAAGGIILEPTAGAIPRFVRGTLTTTTGPVDAKLLMLHLLPKEGRQVNHNAIS